MVLPSHGSGVFSLVTALLLLANTVYSLQANSWQVRLDKALLDIDLKPQARFRLLQRAFQDPKLTEDVTTAVGVIREKGFGKGHPEVINSLWPEGTVARSDLEGLAALQKQVPELFGSLQKQSPTLVKEFQNGGGSSSSAPSIEPGKIINQLVDLAKDDKKKLELQEEAKNALRKTPKGLETPKYKLVRSLDGPMKLGRPEKIEIREYEPYTIARTPMKIGTADDDETADVFGSAAGGGGFGSLAAYLFGENEEKEVMSMTMPVEISKRTKSLTSATLEDNTGSATADMTFVLPRNVEIAPPKPLAGADVTIDRVPSRLVAIKPFAGIVTDEEVERQRDALLTALKGILEDPEAADALGTVRVVDPSAVSVLQYNAPYTIPWRRRNEIAIVVERLQENGQTTVGRVQEEELKVGTVQEQLGEGSVQEEEIKVETVQEEEDVAAIQDVQENTAVVVEKLGEEI